jgi:hypothetical protein
MRHAKQWSDYQDKPASWLDIALKWALLAGIIAILL